MTKQENEQRRLILPVRYQTMMQCEELIESEQYFLMSLESNSEKFSMSSLTFEVSILIPSMNYFVHKKHNVKS